jgi:hypothetical protein
MNFLLAVIFNNYKELIKEENQSYEAKVDNYFIERFKQLD